MKRSYIYILLLFILISYVFFINKHNPNESLHLTIDEYQKLETLAEHNNSLALKRLYEYYRFYKGDENMTISFLQDHLYLSNGYIYHTLAMHFYNSSKKRQEALILLHKAANAGYRDSQKLLSRIYKKGELVERNITLYEYWKDLSEK